MEWVFILLFFVLILAGVYAVARHQVGHKVAAKRLPIVFVCLAAAFGTGALFRLVPTEWKDHVWTGYALLFSFAVWIFLAISLQRTAQAGDILLELGRPRRGLVIGIVAGVSGAFLAIGSIVQAMAESNAGAATQLRHLSGGLFWLSFCLYVSFLWLKKWSIRERGIMAYRQLLPWEMIEDFHWEKGKPSILALSVKRRFGWWRTAYLRIPTEKQKAATEILERNLLPNIEGGSAG